MIIRLSIPLRLSQICEYGGAVFTSQADIQIQRIVTDSRETEKNDLFVAFIGESINGNDFLESVKDCGAVSLSVFGYNADIVCENIELFLLRLANKYLTLLKNIKYRVAVTGSVGKTSTKEFIYSMLSNKYTVHKSFGNYNNSLGLTITILSTPENAEVIVAEMGMNNAGEISLLSRSFMPTHAVITNIGHAHIGKLGSRENIAKAKLEILDGLSGNYLLAPFGEPLLSGAGFLYYSISTIESDRFLSINNENIDYYEKGRLEISAKTKLCAEHHLKSLLIAISIARELGLSVSEIQRGAQSISADILRQKRYSIRGIGIIDDTYSSSPEAVIAELTQLKRTKALFSVLLGDMLELGDKAIEEHEKIGRFVFESGARHLFTFGKLATNIANAARKCGMPDSRIFINEDISNPKKSFDAITENSLNEETVLIKASHAIHAERIVDLLKGQENVR